MKLKLALAIAALICAVGASAAAQTRAASAPDQPWLVEFNGVKADDLSGGEIGIGYRLALGPIRIIPIVGGLLYQADNDRYREETFSNGNTVCRDLSNGQFAKKEKCDNLAVRAYGKVEAVYRLGDMAAIGGGVRVSSKITPYGTASFFVGRQLAIKGFGGPDYYGGGLTYAF